MWFAGRPNPFREQKWWTAMSRFVEDKEWEGEWNPPGLSLLSGAPWLRGQSYWEHGWSRGSASLGGLGSQSSKKEKPAQHMLKAHTSCTVVTPGNRFVCVQEQDSDADCGALTGAGGTEGRGRGQRRGTGLRFVEALTPTGSEPKVGVRSRRGGRAHGVELCQWQARCVSPAIAQRGTDKSRGRQRAKARSLARRRGEFPR